MTDITLTPAEVLRLFWRQTRVDTVPLTVDELGERMGVKRPASSPSVRALIDAGYLDTRKDGSGVDYRRVYFVTDRGETILRRAYARLVAA